MAQKFLLEIANRQGFIELFKTTFVIVIKDIEAYPLAQEVLTVDKLI
jgi:hypothetical protein